MSWKILPMENIDEQFANLVRLERKVMQHNPRWVLGFSGTVKEFRKLFNLQTNDN